MEEFKNTSKAFCYTYERDIRAGETVIVKLPVVTPNKRSINDIGWQCDSAAVTLYATLAADPASAKTMWQEILPEEDINKTASGIKIVNEGAACRIAMRVLLN